ncbi:MAG: nucleotidyltransferase domain-containing protein [Caldisericia bacterium]
MRYFDLLLKRKEERDRYLKNIDFYLNSIKSFFVEKFGNDTKIYIFGSYLTPDFNPNSDIDILVIKKGESLFVKDKSPLIVELRKRIGFVNPFEIHIVSEEEYNEWYSKFIKEKKEI